MIQGRQDDHSDELASFTRDDAQALRLVSLLVGLTNSKDPLATDDVRTLYYEGLPYDRFLKRFQRDRKALASCGVLVCERDTHNGRTGWTIDRGATFAPTDALTREEATLVDVLCMPLANDPAFPYADELALALAKVNRSFTSLVMRRSPSWDDRSRKVLATLLGALRDRHPVAAAYRGADDVEKDVCLAPLGTFGLNGNVYFVACAYDRDARHASAGDVRTYRLDRFRRAKALESHSYQVPKDFDVNSYVLLPFQMGPTLAQAVFALPAAPNTITDQARDAIRTHGRVTTDGSRWEVPMSDVELAAVWSIDVGLRPLGPHDLVTRHEARLRAARRCDERAAMATALLDGAVRDVRRRRPHKTAGRRGGLEEARQLATLVGALDREGASLDATVVAQRLGCDVSQARHLLALLVNASDEKSLFRLPLAADDSMDQVVLAFPTFRGSPLRLTRGESVALFAALGMAGLGPRDALFGRLMRSVASADMSDAVDASTPPVHAPSGNMAEGSVSFPIAAQALALCARAISNGDVLSFSYAPTTSELATDRLVRPLQLRHEEGHWYLDAQDLSRSAMRTFRVDRMSMTAIAGDDVKAPRLKRSRHAAREIAFVLLDMRLVSSLHWHQTRFEELRHADGTYVLATCPYYGGDWLLRRLAACGESVLIPDGWLCDKVRSYAGSLLV